MNTLEELETEQEARRELGSRTRPGPREDLVVRYLAAVAYVRGWSARRTDAEDAERETDGTVPS
ncbi:MAG: hypothetical protein E6F99_25570 [Actinobacteria bacterium]|nr:MAG: hypothetical protein E6F99_25570 [Actinomycetota bacterium]